MATREERLERICRLRSRAPPRALSAGSEDRTEKRREELMALTTPVAAVLGPVGFLDHGVGIAARTRPAMRPKVKGGKIPADRKG